MSNGIALLPSKRPLTRLRDIVENGNAILAYTRGMNFEDFMGNRLVRVASERCLARVSEAAVKLGSVTEDLFPHHRWPDIRGFANMLRHDYADILDEITWAIITPHLPPLLVELETFLAQYPADQETL
jgi:uncharacterized protein with HEPN domain